MNYIKVILPLVLVVLISGCVTTGGGVSGAGLVISEFIPDFQQVHSDETVKLQLKVQNLGAVDAENVEAEIAGIRFSDWSGASTSFENKNLGKIISADASNPEVPGGIKTVEWSLNAPKLDEGMQFTYTPIVKVSYDYETRATKPITIVEQDELRRIQQQGRTLPSQPTSTTAGPLSVDIVTGDYVKTSSRFSTKTYDVFPLYIKITNTGFGSGGTVIDSGAIGGFKDMDYPVEVKITPPAGTSFVYSGTFGDNDCSTGRVTVDLWQGREKEITCELQVDEAPDYRTEGLITVDLAYRYQTESSTQITVFGKRNGFF